MLAPFHVRRHGQVQVAGSTLRRDDDRNLRIVGLVGLGAHREHQPTGRLDLQVEADMGDIADLRPPVGEVEASPHAGVDLGDDHLAFRRRE